MFCDEFKAILNALGKKFYLKDFPRSFEVTFYENLFCEAKHLSKITPPLKFTSPRNVYNKVIDLNVEHLPNQIKEEILDLLGIIFVLTNLIN